jgi:hypothetical protein
LRHATGFVDQLLTVNFKFCAECAKLLVDRHSTWHYFAYGHTAHTTKRKARGLSQQKHNADQPIVKQETTRTNTQTSTATMSLNNMMLAQLMKDMQVSERV